MAEKDTESHWSAHTVDSRVRTMTSKGLLYTLDTKIKNLKCLKSALLKTQGKIVSSMSDINNYDLVRTQYTQWMIMFEDFMKQSDEFSSFVDSTEDVPSLYLDLPTNFSDNVKAFQQFKETVDDWIQGREEQRQQNAKESDKCMSKSNKSSRHSSIKSSVSAARLKEQQLRAELLAKSAALKQKESLEIEKVKLKLKEEKLTLHTEMAISDARSKALEDFEKEVCESSRASNVADLKGDTGDEVAEDNPFMSRDTKKKILEDFLNDSQGFEIQTQDVKKVVVDFFNDAQGVDNTTDVQGEDRKNGSTRSRKIDTSDDILTSADSRFPGADRHLHYPEHGKNDNVSDILTSVVHHLSKPVPEISVFSGNPMDYHKFVRQFKTKVLNNTCDADERMTYLEQFTSGEAKKIVSSYVCLDARKGFPAAMHDLEEKYGDENVVVNSFISKALNWPVIRADSPKGLEDYAVFLNECNNAVGSSGVLNNIDNIRRIIAKVPYTYQERFRSHAQFLNDSGKSLGFQDVVYFMRREAKKANDPVFGKDALNSLQPRLPSKQVKGKGTLSKLSLATDVQSSAKCITVVQPVDKCLYCAGKGHRVGKCDKFDALSYSRKWTFVMDKRLCFRCLVSGHRSKECPADIVCSVCQGRHNTYFHMDHPLSQSQQFVPSVTSASNSCLSSDTGVGQEKEMCTMVIIPVKVKMRNCSHCVETYAFLDPGSSSTFCTESLMRKLGVHGKQMKVNITSMGEPRTIKTWSLTGLQMFDLDMDNNVNLPRVFTVDKLPVSRVHIPTAADVAKWPHLKDLHIPAINADIGLLIGNNIADAYTPLEVIVGPEHTPHATKTRLGWAVWNLSRPSDTSSHEVEQCVMNRTEVTAIQEFESLDKLDRMVRHSFNSDFPERLIDDERQYSQEDKLFMKKVDDSITLQDGHYSIALPFRNTEVVFPNNYGSAHRLLLRLKKRLETDDKFKEEYSDFMENLFKKGYAEIISSEEEEPVDGSVWYIPHHGVFHPQKKKIRVVFNCAFVCDGVSLNQQLLSGPDLTSSLLGVLMKFRQEPYAAMGDIESMFYQVRVVKEHWNYQRFLWWPQGDCTQEPVKCRMKVHMFGATSSPSCANAALLQTAKDNEGDFSQTVSDTIRNSFYVDDCLSSEPTVAEAAKQVHEVTEMCSKGGFKLRKWISNCSEILDDVPLQDRGESARDFNLEEIKGEGVIERALGVNWKVQKDLLGFQVKTKTKGVTRRMVLSVVSSVYDPLGLGSPFVLKAKILLQEICRSGIGWDEEIAGTQLKSWHQWLTDLPRLENLCVPRCYKPTYFGTVVDCQLHLFADASELGYGVVAYFRFENGYRDVHCTFVLSKARVTPLKKISIPILELTAACVAVRLSLLVQKQVKYKIDEVFYWTDSMTVLRYLANEKTRFKTFVANRIAVIRDGSDIDHWNYVSTKENPADPASRGLNMKEFTDYSPIWFQGPSFLSKPETEWPNVEVGELPENEPEIKTVNTTHLQVSSKSPLDKLVDYCSSWMKLKKFVGYFLLFFSYLKWKSSERKPFKAKLDVETLQKAEKVILTQVQHSHAQEVFDALENKRVSTVNKSIRKLDPFVDGGLIRVGGRLSRSCLDFETKYPVLLPKESRVTDLIVQDAHEVVGHLGKAAMTTHLRQKYWIIGLGYLIKNITSKCVICRSYVTKQNNQKMADLPLDRVSCDEAPFTRVGVDYFGPFAVKRGRSNVKRYGVVFTCLASRAIHLEVASQLDTSSCINAIRRFIARRGCPKKIWSDNGTNFIGSKRELQEATESWNLHQIHQEMLQKGIAWEFNPPMGSHFGGAWERMIRTIRKIMYSLLRSQVIKMDDEGIHTLFCEIESIVNNRPITTVSSDINDLSPLTPNHILLLRSGERLPPGLYTESDCYTRRRWRQIQYLANIFWKRWSQEYLTSLQERQKWTSPRRNVHVDDVVLIKDNLPRSSWSLGRVTKVLTDKKGFVRTVELKTATSTLTRPIDKLCVILEVKDE